MNLRSANRFLVPAVFATAGLWFLQTSSLLAAPAAANEGKVVRPTTITAVAWGVSKPLRDMTPGPPDPAPTGGKLREMPDKAPVLHPLPNAPKPHDPLVQTARGSGLIPAPIVSFDGMFNRNGVQPADSTMDVSPSQILDWKNLSYQVLDKSGNLLAGPFDGTNFWSGLNGSPCQTFNGGDILVRWDQFASQWFVSQLAYPGPPQGFHQCVAVSTTSDATGSYYQYDFLYSAVDLNDYPKSGLWPDPTNNGYYITVRNFAGGSSFTGMKIIALDRAKMLTGTPGTAQLFNVGALAPNLDGLLPTDLRGPNAPPNGSLETYVGYGSPQTDGSASTVIHLFQTFVDFSNPANSTLTQLPDIAVASFDPSLLNGAPQMGGGTLETLPFSMYRADYRVFLNSDSSINHDSLLLLHDVNVAATCGGSEQGGSRWHEVRGVNSGGPPVLYQEGTYGPCDGTYRWMGSIAQDASGDIALGFSASSSGGGIVHDPSVHYTGRLADDALGTMGQGEGTFLDSNQPFSGFRWGDYSTIVADPVDQCTFWYTTMYGAGDWKTRIGSFKFPSCTSGPSGTLTGRVTDASNGNPLVGAIVSATGTAGTSTTVTNSNGNYSFALPVDNYNMTVTISAYVPGSATGVAVTANTTTTQNFPLTSCTPPTAVASGTATICAGSSTPLSGSGGVSCSWTPAAGLDNPNSCTPLASPSATTTYTLTVTDAIGCVSTNNPTVTVTVKPLPTATVSGSTSICQGASATIHAALTGTSPWSLTWSDGFTQTGITSSPATRSVGPASTTTYTVTAVSDANCVGTSSGSATVTVNPLPIASASGSATICTGQSTPLSGSGGFSCFWTPATGLSNVHTCSPTASPVSTTTYTLTVMDVHGCVSTNNPTVTVTVNPVPAPVITVSHCVAPSTSGLMASVPANAGDTYNWTIVGGTIDAGQGTNAISCTSGGAGTRMTLSVDETSPASCVGTAADALQVDFNDVPSSDPFYSFVCAIGRDGITSGCGAGNYCPNSPVTRAQMAVFLLKAEHGPNYTPPACKGIFADVECTPTPAFAVDWIEQLSSEGITGGCGGGNYCPNDPVTRAQMAVFLLRAQHGPGYTPPVCHGVFADVPCPGGFAVNWIEQLSTEGITGGCGGGNYCPDNPNTRAQMAVFLTTTFKLQ